MTAGRALLRLLRKIPVKGIVAGNMPGAIRSEAELALPRYPSVSAFHAAATIRDSMYTMTRKKCQGCVRQALKNICGPDAMTRITQYG